MPKLITRAILTLNPLRLIIEQESLPSSSMFPVADVVETTAEPRPSDHPPRPLSKCGAGESSKRRAG